MRRSGWFALSLGMLVLAPLAGRAEDKGKVVELDGLMSSAPAAWKSQAPTNQMRFAQFQLPKVEGDKEDAELVIFRGIGGSAKQNIDRWKAMFVPAKGDNPDVHTKVTELKVGDKAQPYLQICGTYKFKAAPFDPNAKEEFKADYCMLAVVFQGNENVYHIRVVGPEKTVKHYQKDFEDWVKAFK